MFVFCSNMGTKCELQWVLLMAARTTRPTGLSRSRSASETRVVQAGGLLHCAVCTGHPAVLRAGIRGAHCACKGLEREQLPSDPALCCAKCSDHRCEA